jgi:hypothetical protein
LIYVLWRSAYLLPLELRLRTRTHEGHGEIPKLLPQILDSVHPDHGHGKHTNPLDTTYTSN